jgi:ATP-dependent RNA helicase RhlB
MVKALIQKVLNKLRPSKKSTAPAAASAPAAKPHAEKSAHGPRPSRSHRPHTQHHGPRAHAHERQAPAPQPAPEPWDKSLFNVPPQEGKVRFQDMDLPDDILHAIFDLKFQYCTPVQAMTLPHALEGKDVFGRAQTGTGKTAAFLISTFTRLLRHPLNRPLRPGTPRALVLAPTRELCMQIHKDAEALGKYSGLNCIAVFGGMDFEKQRRQLRGKHVDLVVATPGRLLDFKRKGDLHLNHVEVLIIDEGDRMLDMGFIPDVRSIIISTPPKTHRQTLLFSATLPDEVQRLASNWTRDPVKIDIEPEQVAVDTVKQVVYIVTLQQKWSLFYNILKKENPERVMVFGNRRDEVERLCDRLKGLNINCALLSGAVPQHKRLRVLEDFRAGKIRVLVATDVAGRGIHVDAVSHVVNYNLPLDPEDYVHRIGRTGRAGASGISISFADEDDAFHLPDIEKYIGRPLPCTHPEDELLVAAPEPEGGHREHSGHREHHGGRGGPHRGPRRGGPRRHGPRRGPSR